LNQEQLSQLVSLLQQSNLLSSTSSSSNSSSLQVVSDTSPSINTILGIYYVSTHLHSPSKYWIIDSGANDQICSSLQFFSSFYKIKPIRVSLPNGQFVIVEYVGNVQFSPQLHISHVLYSPMFKMNLIYVSKLCASISYHVIFSDSTCMIQDIKCHQMIGLGELVNGLYKLKVQTPYSSDINYILSLNKISNSCNNVVSDTYIPISPLWHFRLGHLSN